MQIRALLADLKQQNYPDLGQLTEAGAALVLSEISRLEQRLLVVVVADSQSAEKLSQEASFFLDQGDHNILSFPDWETLPYDLFSPHDEIVSDRLNALQRLSETKQGVLIVPTSTLMQRVIPKQWVLSNCFDLSVGDQLDLDAFKKQLLDGGYRRVDQVLGHGEFAHRGSLIDLYPMGSKNPVRIDLFDDEIESLRVFEPDNQRTILKTEQVKVLPAREFPLDKESVNSFRSKFRQQFSGDPQKSLIYTSVSQGAPCGGIEYYLPLFFEKLETLFSYLPANALFCQLHDALDHADDFFSSTQERFEQRRHDQARPVLPPEQLYLDSDSIRQKINQYDFFSATSIKLTKDQDVNIPIHSLPELAIKVRQEDPAAAIQKFINDHEQRVLFTAESAGRREFLLETLRPFGIRPKECSGWHEFLNSETTTAVSIAPLESGLRLSEDGMAIIPEFHLIGSPGQRTKKRRRKTPDADAIVRNLTELNIGSPVVHEEHGVGRYLGLERIEISGTETEFLSMEYAGSDKLYVPVASLHLISRYTGADPEHAPLHKLGTDQWQKIKRKAAQKAHDVAAELLDIYARRAARVGHAYTLDEQEYQAFCASFPYQETEDQENVITAVLADMQAPQPMDRVVCGDVGFGKTEVAMRAAFVAVVAGKQVAILVPTTLLAEQHAANFADRFANWPVQVESLSRFRKPSESKAIMASLADGTTDIVIGTHKLLQKDINFKRLGLVVVDEEQRFGVRQKEKLKSLRSEVDILTMTATPIPRTMNMSLSGLRDMSIIATPPMLRQPIKTFVSTWDDGLISEACLREINRGGQIFYLHNEVKTIEKAAYQLQQLLPDVAIEIAHGQMPEKQLGQVMDDFYHQRFTILVCTTIIETGIDIPSANTIVINRADKFGLAQLHQLRGRVGRSHHRAYAYLMTPERKAMSADAIKRLEAIESLEDLGVGFTLASHDLEIRGAGELLGDGQSGQIQEIGFSMYNELLERAVRSLKSGEHNEDLLDNSITEVDLGLPALLPDDYVPDVHSRLILYKRIASAKDKEELKDLKIELIDRFGLLPEFTQYLFDAQELRRQANRLGIKKITAGNTWIKLNFTKAPNINVNRLLKLVQQNSEHYTLKGQESLRFVSDEMQPQELIEAIAELLTTLTPAQQQAA